MISVQNATAGLVATLSIVMVNSVVGQTIEPRKLMGTINEESSWSPDGKTIAFDSIRSGKLNIYTWRIDAGVETNHHDRGERFHAGMVTRWKTDRVCFGSHRAQ